MTKKNKPQEKSQEGAAPKKPIDYTPRQERKWRESSERNPWPPVKRTK